MKKRGEKLVDTTTETTTMASDAATSAGPTKKRGRPKGSKNKVVAAKAKPKKTAKKSANGNAKKKVVAKKPATKKKSKPVVVEAKVAKKRGRPPGSKNKVATSVHTNGMNGSAKKSPSITTLASMFAEVEEVIRHQGSAIRALVHSTEQLAVLFNFAR